MEKYNKKNCINFDCQKKKSEKKEKKKIGTIIILNVQFKIDRGNFLNFLTFNSKLLNLKENLTFFMKLLSLSQ